MMQTLWSYFPRTSGINQLIRHIIPFNYLYRQPSFNLTLNNTNVLGLNWILLKKRKFSFPLDIHTNPFIPILRLTGKTYACILYDLYAVCMSWQRMFYKQFTRVNICNLITVHGVLFLFAAYRTFNIKTYFYYLYK